MPKKKEARGRRTNGSEAIARFVFVQFGCDVQPTNSPQPLKQEDGRKKRWWLYLGKSIIKKKKIWKAQHDVSKRSKKSKNGKNFTPINWGVGRRESKKGGGEKTQMWSQITEHFHLTCKVKSYKCKIFIFFFSTECLPWFLGPCSALIHSSSEHTHISGVNSRSARALSYMKKKNANFLGQGVERSSTQQRRKHKLVGCCKLYVCFIP